MVHCNQSLHFVSFTPSLGVFHLHSLHLYHQRRNELLISKLSSCGFHPDYAIDHTSHKVEISHFTWFVYNTKVHQTSASIGACPASPWLCLSTKSRSGKPSGKTQSCHWLGATMALTLLQGWCKKTAVKYLRQELFMLYNPTQLDRCGGAQKKCLRPDPSNRQWLWRWCSPSQVPQLYCIPPK